MDYVSLDDILPKVTEEIAQELQRRAVASFEYRVAEAVEAQIKVFIAEKVMPEVAKELEAHSAEIRAALVAGITGACHDAADAVRVAMTKKLSGYEGDKVIAALLQPLIPRAY